MQMEPTEYKVPELINVLENKEVEVDGEQYTIYFESKINEKDRCFGYSTTDNPDNINLLQITNPIEVESDVAKKNLESIDMTNTEIYTKLIKLGLTLKQRETPSMDDIILLREKIFLGDSEYLVSYQSYNLGVLGVSIHEVYAKKVYARNYK